ncbi:MAG: hypothetical protein I8H77_08455 [Comamonadaceae bacterium]|nr:hypothetical protein [Comamonadaceae bacterium]
MMRMLFLRLCWLLPVIMLAANALAWLRYGTDFPFFDDWRAYATGDIESFSASRLFQVVNNTMSPVGFALDALAQRWLDGNTVAYQLLSMLAVLGGLLWLQWKLLEWSVASALVRAVAFAFTVFMLQSSSYWGEQNLAYHQALPLLFLLAALYAVLVSRLHSWALAGVVAVLALLAGFSYISGAVATVVMGGILLVRVRWGGGDPTLKSRAWRGALVLVSVGALTTSIQFYATRLVGGSDRSEAFPVRWPYHPDFWAYMLGKVGRSAGNAFQNASVELGFALALSALLVFVLLAFGKRLLARDDVTIDRLSYVFLPVAGAVLVYLCLVSFGRAGFRDDSIQSLRDVFLFAYQRFHFFWLTLLFPWAVSALLLMARSKRPAVTAGQVPRLDVAVACAVLALGGWLAGARGVFDVATYYQQGSQTRAATIRCMSEQLGSGQPIMCPEFALPGWTDWTPAYLHARQIGASFTKYFPLTPHEAPRQWLFNGVPDAQAGISWHDAKSVGGGWRRGEADPQVTIESAEAGPYARCRMLDLWMRLKSEQVSTAQVFYRPPGVEAFSESLSVIKPVAASAKEPVELRFLIESTQGFAPVLRIDPVQGDMRFTVEEVRVACSLQAP